MLAWFTFYLRPVLAFRYCRWLCLCVHVCDYVLMASFSSYCAGLVYFLPEACFGLQVLSLAVSVCPCVWLCINDKLFQMITHRPFQARITKFGPEIIMCITPSSQWSLSKTAWTPCQCTLAGGCCDMYKYMYIYIYYVLFWVVMNHQLLFVEDNDCCNSI